MTQPLLVIDGDSFAHRAYHAVPKSVRREDNKGGGAIVGFANYLIRLLKRETSRRSRRLGYAVRPNGGRSSSTATRPAVFSSDDIIDQLDVLPELVTACGFANAKQAGFEADDFLAAAVASEETRGGNVSSRAATATLSSSPPSSPPSSSRSALARSPASARPRCAPAMASSRSRCPTSSPSRRPVRQDPRCERDRSGRCGEPAAEVRHARSGLAVWPFSRAGERAAPLSRHRDDGRLGAASRAAQPEPEVGRGREACGRLEAGTACRSPSGARRWAGGSVVTAR